MPRINSKTFYSSSLKKYGHSARGVNWISSQTQELRFDIIIELLEDKMSTINIIDAGCGFGDFYNYLLNKNLQPKSYIGIDSLKNMCSIASKQTQQNILNLDITKEKIPSCDYYVCSGALNILTPFETHLFIANCYKASKKGFIFNALFAQKSSQTYNYLCKDTILDIAKELNVKEVVFNESYLENDITVRFLR